MDDLFNFLFVCIIILFILFMCPVIYCIADCEKLDERLSKIELLYDDYDVCLQCGNIKYKGDI